MTTFVTGATGHVGANLVRALLDRGEAVRALVRDDGDPSLVGLDVERVGGDLRDAAAMERAVAGCDHVYHVAAPVSLRPGARREIFDVNVFGTKHVLRASIKANVKRRNPDCDILAFALALHSAARLLGSLVEISSNKFERRPYQ